MGAAAAAGRVTPSRSTPSGVKLRPPGALEEDEFKSKCVRCFKCGEVCQNGCIEFHGLDQGLANAFTPYIHARSRGCTACMKCTQVCPSGALTPIELDDDAILASVDMGTARLNREMCYSFADPAPRTCGVCYRACPFPGKAMTIGLYEQPTVHPDQCIGCGLCEQACVHLPQAIRVIPSS
jgi:MauM/NapG family ferredoxin protein